MSHEYCDFKIVIREGDGEEVSAYVLARNPYRGRAFRSAIEAAYGAIPNNMSLSQAFAAVREVMMIAARRKIIALDGEIDQPVPLISADICDLPGNPGNPGVCAIR